MDEIWRHDKHLYNNSDLNVDIVIQQNTTVKYLYESSNDVFESKQEHAVQQYVA
jgi:hypothetical protein